MRVLFAAAMGVGCVGFGAVAVLGTVVGGLSSIVVICAAAALVFGWLTLLVLGLTRYG